MTARGDHAEAGDASVSVDRLDKLGVSVPQAAASVDVLKVNPRHVKAGDHAEAAVAEELACVACRRKSVNNKVSFLVKTLLPLPEMCAPSEWPTRWKLSIVALLWAMMA